MLSSAGQCQHAKAAAGPWRHQSLLNCCCPRPAGGAVARAWWMTRRLRGWTCAPSCISVTSEGLCAHEWLRLGEAGNLQGCAALPAMCAPAAAATMCSRQSSA